MNPVIRDLRAHGVTVYTRTDWGSEQQKAGAYKRRRDTHQMPSPEARYGFLHLSVTPDTDLPAEAKAAARVIERYGYSTPPMVSYHWLTTNEGIVLQGQNLGVKGTHTINDKHLARYPYDLNAYGYAVALMQNVQDPVTDVQVDVVAMLFASMKRHGYLRDTAPILPHRMFAAKSCPGDKAMAKLATIRRRTARYARNGLPDLR